MSGLNTRLDSGRGPGRGSGRGGGGRGGGDDRHLIHSHVAPPERVSQGKRTFLGIGVLLGEIDGFPW